MYQFDTWPFCLGNDCPAVSVFSEARMLKNRSTKLPSSLMGLATYTDMGVSKNQGLCIDPK